MMCSSKREGRTWRWKREFLFVFAFTFVPVMSQQYAPTSWRQEPAPSAPYAPVTWARKKTKADKDDEAEPATEITWPPSPNPTTSPTTASPTTTPTEPPTRFPVVSLEAQNVEMIIKGILLPLDPFSKVELERVIHDGIEFSIQKTIGLDQIEHVDIDVELVPHPAEQKKAARSSTSNNKNETIAFNAEIEIQSVLAKEHHDVKRYTVGAFNDPVEQERFVRALVATDDPAFANVTAISMGNDFIGTPSTTDTSDTSRNTAGVAIAILVAIGAVITAAVGFLYLHRRNERLKDTSSVDKNNKKQHKTSPSSHRLEKIEQGSAPSDCALNEVRTDSSNSAEFSSHEIPYEVVVDGTSVVDEASSKEPEATDSFHVEEDQTRNTSDSISEQDFIDEPVQAYSPIPITSRPDYGAQLTDEFLTDTLANDESMLDYDFEEIFGNDGGSHSSKPTYPHMLPRRMSSMTDEQQSYEDYSATDYKIPGIDDDTASRDNATKPSVKDDDVDSGSDSGCDEGAMESIHCDFEKIFETDGSLLDRSESALSNESDKLYDVPGLDTLNDTNDEAGVLKDEENVDDKPVVSEKTKESATSPNETDSSNSTGNEFKHQNPSMVADIFRSKVPFVEETPKPSVVRQESSMSNESDSLLLYSYDKQDSTLLGTDTTNTSTNDEDVSSDSTVEDVCKEKPVIRLNDSSETHLLDEDGNTVVEEGEYAS